MPEQPQTTVDVLETPGALGDVSGFSTSDTESLKVAFPGSPIYADYDPKEFFEKNYPNLIEIKKRPMLMFMAQAKEVLLTRKTHRLAFLR